MMRDMQVGDGVFFYHSNTAVPGIAGWPSRLRQLPDPTQFNKKSDYYDAPAPGKSPLVAGGMSVSVEIKAPYLAG